MKIIGLSKKKKTTNMPVKKEYLSDHRCERINMVANVKYLWMLLNTLYALALHVNTLFVDTYGCTILKIYWHK